MAANRSQHETRPSHKSTNGGFLLPHTGRLPMYEVFLYVTCVTWLVLARNSLDKLHEKLV